MHFAGWNFRMDYYKILSSDSKEEFETELNKLTQKGLIPIWRTFKVAHCLNESLLLKNYVIILIVKNEI